ncbi:MAG TPA: heavy metal translocating P-type ATPase metal-binding domain-containing protein, partial [Flavitalea sp.]|nr:heavy metal translocating P-type ATPase metal-binding domain-containing protein [Flavitalea sp.]
MVASVTPDVLVCTHCGEPCYQNKIGYDSHAFCCEGCKMVYQLLNQHGLCDYYTLNEKPGITQQQIPRKNKFAFLDDEKIHRRLVSFSDDTQTHVTFYLPQMHCSSCLYLLENLSRLNKAVISSKVHFTRKEVTIVFNHDAMQLRDMAELLTSIGYEPHISLNDLQDHRPKAQKTLLYQLGIAGFCFANIMLLSFPEYLGLEPTEKSLQYVFRTLNFILALPVFLFSALPFYESGWKGLKHRFLNIDAPIALAVIVTFLRSAYEVISGTGAGYFDSMSGIVFFMLVGRVLQDRTYQHLSFDRDFTSYFPIAVSVIKAEAEIPTALPDIVVGDTLKIHNEELIPADGILTRGQAYIDYSFVTGESIPVRKNMGEIVYAGGKQTGSMIEILVIKEVAQSYLTGLWSRDEFKKSPVNKQGSFVHLLSRYFTYIVFTIALTAGIYWYFTDPSVVWNVVTAVLIVACPCALLLSNTFTNGNILRILSRNKLYLRNAETIETIANVDHIVFDKTGTLTDSKMHDVEYSGESLTPEQERLVGTLSLQSNHPLSKAVSAHLGIRNPAVVKGYKETPGMGIEGFVDGELVTLGSEQFITGRNHSFEGSTVFVAIENKTYGCFRICNHYRDSISTLINGLRHTHKISVISGDNPSGRTYLDRIVQGNAEILFNQKPEDKLEFIKKLQAQGNRVMMVGDGLNDAGALKQSDVGIAVTEDSNSFTPASDGIIAAGKLWRLKEFIDLCISNRRIVIASFVLSIMYNVIGIYFAVQGSLTPMVAAIL